MRWFFDEVQEKKLRAEILWRCEKEILYSVLPSPFIMDDQLEISIESGGNYGDPNDCCHRIYPGIAGVPVKRKEFRERIKRKKKRWSREEKKF